MQLWQTKYQDKTLDNWIFRKDFIQLRQEESVIF